MNSSPQISCYNYDCNMCIPSNIEMKTHFPNIPYNHHCILCAYILLKFNFEIHKNKKITESESKTDRENSSTFIPELILCTN